MTISEASLRNWMTELGPRLVSLSTRICHDRQRAEEIVQDAFVKLWHRPPDAGEVAYRSWLRRVVVNLSINALQRTRRASALPEFSTDPAMHSGDEATRRRDASEELRAVQAALARLDESKRIILVLRGHEQLSYEEIAEYLGVPIGTVMSRLNRARAALLEELQREMTDTDADGMVFDFSKYKRA